MISKILKVKNNKNFNFVNFSENNFIFLCLFFKFHLKYIYIILYLFNLLLKIKLINNLIVSINYKY